MYFIEKETKKSTKKSTKNPKKKFIQSSQSNQN